MPINIYDPFKSKTDAKTAAPSPKPGNDPGAVKQHTTKPQAPQPTAPKPFAPKPGLTNPPAGKPFAARPVKPKSALEMLGVDPGRFSRDELKGELYAARVKNAAREINEPDFFKKVVMPAYVELYGDKPIQAGHRRPASALARLGLDPKSEDQEGLRRSLYRRAEETATTRRHDEAFRRNLDDAWREIHRLPRRPADNPRQNRTDQNRESQTAPTRQNRNTQIAQTTPRPGMQAPQPRPIAEIEQETQGYVGILRDNGYYASAANLDRFLDGTGGIVQVEPQLLLNYGVIKDAEQTLQCYFLGWMTGAIQSQTPSEQIISQLPNLQDGQSITVSSHWDNDMFSQQDNFETIVAFADFLLERAHISDPESADFLGAVGRNKLEADGTFTFQRVGNEMHFTGTIQYDWEDLYDWHAGEVMNVPFMEIEIDHDEMILLQNQGGAAAFTMQSSWQQQVQGVLSLVSPGPSRQAPGGMRIVSVQWSATP